MKTTYQYSYVSKKGVLTPLKEVLEQWLILNDRYYTAEKDIVSCYTELSCVSHLNAAFWSCESGDWVGLQEYQEEKRENSRGRKKTQGRVDLFVKNKQTKFVAEAKRIFINVKSTSPHKLLAKLDEKAWSAWDDTKKNVEQLDADNLLSITFFDFQFPCDDDREKKQIGTRIKEYIDLIKSEPFDAGAYWFFKSPIVEGGWAYCGTYLVIEKYSQ